VKKATERVERRKHEQWVGLDRRRHDDDFAERMTGGIRASASDRQGHVPQVKKDRPR
jgi:hypothetical protein